MRQNAFTMLRLALILLSLCSFACTNYGARMDRYANDAGLWRHVITGDGYRHVIYMKTAPAAESKRLLVFFEGDGRPWIHGGREPATDPTTRNPLALQLLARTNAAGIYVSRPCYQEMMDAACTNEAWTGGRYSAEVVASLIAAIESIMRDSGAHEIIFIGYSGGGTLAVLAAERMQHVAGVVTIGANLDIDAWTRHHGYLPLSTSLNPAASHYPHPWPELHLIGGRDTIVPSTTRIAYFERYPSAKQRVFDEFDHVCCWVEEWGKIAKEVTQ